MSTDIKETAVSAIQRDRLSEFIKKTYESNGACFYYSIINAFNYLNPDTSVPKEFEANILVVLQKNPDFGVNFINVIPEIKRLEPLLHLTVSKIHTYATGSVEEIRKKLNISDDIPVSKMEKDSFRNLEHGSTAILLLQNEDSTHLIHVVPNKMPLIKDEDNSSYVGGELEYRAALKLKYKPVAAIYLSKSQI